MGYAYCDSKTGPCWWVDDNGDIYEIDVATALPYLRPGDPALEGALEAPVAPSDPYKPTEYIPGTNKTMVIAGAIEWIGNRFYKMYDGNWFDRLGLKNERVEYTFVQSASSRGVIWINEKDGMVINSGRDTGQPVTPSPVEPGTGTPDTGWAARVASLEKLVGELLRANGGGYAKSERLFINVETERAKVEAALRMGLNGGAFTMGDVESGKVNVIEELAKMTGLPAEKVGMYLKQTLAAGASALTMVLSAGNFPLAAAAYFGTQALLPMPTGSSDGGKKQPFTGVAAEGSLDGQPLTATAVRLPLGLPHDVFEPYRFVCYDHLTGRWFPSDEITPLNYWSNEPYRYTVLDRINSKVYHCDQVRAVRLYV